MSRNLPNSTLPGAQQTKPALLLPLSPVRSCSLASLFVSSLYMEKEHSLMFILKTNVSVPEGLFYRRSRNRIQPKLEMRLSQKQTSALVPKGSENFHAF